MSADAPSTTTSSMSSIDHTASIAVAEASLSVDAASPPPAMTTTLDNNSTSSSTSSSSATVGDDDAGGETAEVMHGEPETHTQAPLQQPNETASVIDSVAGGDDDDESDNAAWWLLTDTIASACAATDGAVVYTHVSEAPALEGWPDGALYTAHHLTVAAPTHAPTHLQALVGVAVVMTMATAHRRIEQVVRQLARVAPSRAIIVLENPGQAGKTALEPGRRSTEYDINHAHETAIRVADTFHPEAECVLVLEDDFVWLAADDAQTAADLDAVGQFLAPQTTRRAYDLYALGCMPLPMHVMPLLTSPAHWRIWRFGCFHAVVYTRRGRRAALPLLAQGRAATGVERHVDAMLSSSLRCCMYYRAIAAQTFPNTPNQSRWEQGWTRWLICTLGLDKSPSPGTEITYIGAIALSILFPIMCLVLAGLLGWSIYRVYCSNAA